MDESIVSSIKNALGLADEYDPFDKELLMYINSAVATLTQLGVGPSEGIIVDPDTKWAVLLEDQAKLQGACSYISMRVKLLFDTGSMSQHVVAAHEKMIEEEAWRLTVASDPMVPWAPPVLEDPVLDGGGA